MLADRRRVEHHELVAGRASDSAAHPLGGQLQPVGHGTQDLIAERVARHGARATFDEFVAEHPDLLDWSGRGLRALYRPETLAAPLAKRVFVLPDRLEPRESSE